jgi:polysaccharide export outer membrane protein
VLEAIMHAGGFNKASARMANVVVIRNHEGRQHSCSLDLRKAIEEPASDPFYLEPNDIVFVPRTAIDRVDQWVDQYINQIVPRAVHYNFTHEVSVRRSGGSNNIASQLLGNAANLSSGPRLGGLSSGTN